MSSPSEFHGHNLGYVLELYDRYLEAPESLDPDTREFFRQWSPNIDFNGVSAAQFTTEAATDLRKVVGAVGYAQAIRQFGHRAAQLDPLGNPPPGDPELNPEWHEINEADLRALPAGIIDGPIVQHAENAWQAIQKLHAIYCSTIGYDNDHISNPQERVWLREAIESRRYAFDDSTEEARALLERLVQVDVMEQFLQRTFPTKYRFSIEGLDMMVPMLDEIVDYAKETHVELLTVAMAHRGRLNVLAHIMGRGYDEILAEFKDTREHAEEIQAIGYTVDDVKYHKGATYQPADSQLTLKMPPNPSHLEAVNPVAIGLARAAGTACMQPGPPQFDPSKVLQVLIHGDAAFPGQGIVAETFNLSRLPGYAVGGTIHIIANNQLGFTTLPEDGRSTLYASDLAKGFKVPIVHVNADDPAACIEVARLAAAYQQEFERDFLIDLIGYRRYGHNELDEPGFTQPMMYEQARNHDAVRKLWAKDLIERGVISADDAEELVANFNDQIQQIYDEIAPTQEGISDPQPEQPPKGAAKALDTTVSADDLRAINESLHEIVEGFNFYSTRFKKTLLGRRDALDDAQQRSIDWATAEELAFATILAQGIPIRMSGQDAQRGTFSHRHAVLHDAENGEELTPLQALPQAQASFEIINSPLSEAAVLGFEYGYSAEARNTLVVWEAQYGDFVNGAQNIIDEFIVSAREKWGDLPSLVMLLPHGHEGAGPDHSSGRLERFLSLAAKINMRIANCTTAGQYFHLLRRQALLLETDPLPLVVMSPKSLLRNPVVASSLKDLTEGRWQPVIDDAQADPQNVERLAFVSGKFYYDLIDSAYREQYPEVALVRVEQLYPFPVEPLTEIWERYPNVKQIVWAQEEPKNMGAWEFMGYRLKKLVGMDTPVNYVGRRRSSSPAEGSKTAWKVNQSMITEYTFNWDFEKGKAMPKKEGA